MGFSFKKIRKASMVCLAFGILLVNSRINTMGVFAGAIDKVIDNTSFEKELDSSKWNVPNGDVVVENGKLIFTSDSTEDTKLITMNAAKLSGFHQELFQANFTLKLQDIPEGQRFAVGFSLEDVESSMEEAESIQIIFQKKSGLKVSVLAYDENGEVSVLAEERSCDILEGADFSISAIATKDMKMCLEVNNQKLYDAVAPMDLTGRIGFLQSGSCHVEISNVSVVYHEYDRPENVNIAEDFENGTFNYNALTSKMLSNAKSYPNGIQVEEYEGSKVLMFRSVAMGYFGTKYTYSNFEVSFDIPFMQHKAVMSEEGQILSMQHSAFVVGIGDDAAAYDKQHGYLTSAEGVVFSSTEVASLNKIVPAVKLADKNYFDMDKNEGYSVKISVIDSVVTVYLKALQATTYDKIMEYKLGNETPTGYVHFFANGQSNFAIDNFRLVNKDQEAKMLDVEYKESFLTGTEDWEYVPEETVYLEDAEAKNEFPMATLPIIAGAVSVIGIAVCVFVARRKNASDKVGGGQHEE